MKHWPRSDMANRDSALRRLPGNPLGGVLRQTARAARSTTRRSVAVPGPEGPIGPEGPPATGIVATAVASLTSDDAGVATWIFPAETPRAVIVATPVGPAFAVAVVAEVSATGATLVTYGAGGAVAPRQRLQVALFETPEDVAPVDSDLQPELTEGT